MILRVFDEFCITNNIEYVISSGAALGAVRHGGFIPWDDDIDVFMDSNNFNKFVALANEELCDRYYLLNRETDMHVPVMNTHLCLKGTEFRTADQYNIKNTGIFLDIFCFDNVPDDDEKMRWQWKKAWFWGKLMTLSEVKNPVIMCGGIRKKIFRVVLRIAHYGMRIIGLTPEFCYRKAEYYRNLYNGENTKRIAYLFGSKLFLELCDREDVFPPRRVQFEDVEVNAPKKIEKYLVDTYGDYMKLPPEEKRHNHVPEKLDFGPYK